MPRKPLPPDEPQAWMRRAQSNLIRARHRMAGVYLEDLCFDAQQAAEKAVKAVCISRGIEFPYVHDLAELTTLLEERIRVPADVQQAARLTRYAIVTRYPGLSDPVTEYEYEQAVAIAKRVVEWAEAVVEAGA